MEQTVVTQPKRLQPKKPRRRITPATVCQAIHDVPYIVARALIRAVRAVGHCFAWTWDAIASDVRANWRAFCRGRLVTGCRDALRSPALREVHHIMRDHPSIRAITMIAATAVIFAAAVMAEPVRTIDAICIVVDGDGPHTTEAERLSSLLRRSGIRLGEDEMVELNVAGEDPAIRISDTLTYQHYVTVETDYKILRSPDPLMDKGTEEIIRKGIPGQIVETYEDTVVSGEVVSTKYIGASHDTSHAELVRYGTRVYEVEEGDTIEKDFPNEVGEGGYLLFASGDTMTYNKVMLCSSTAYYSGGDGGAAWTTAVGAAVGVGTVAVDPKVIPYYTKMFIQTTNGRRVYGMGTALDCGGAVKGNIVDLWFPTKADCYSWGRRNVTVYILDKKAS